MQLPLPDLLYFQLLFSQDAFLPLGGFLSTEHSQRPASSLLLVSAPPHHPKQVHLVCEPAKDFSWWSLAKSRKGHCTHIHSYFVIALMHLKNHCSEPMKACLRLAVAVQCGTSTPVLLLYNNSYLYEVTQREILTGSILPLPLPIIAMNPQMVTYNASSSMSHYECLEKLITFYM